MNDLIIIGAGPCGITASIFAARKKMDFLLITEDIGGQALLTNSVENYTGFTILTGPELVAKFKEQLDLNNIAVKTGETIISIVQEDGLFKVKTSKAEYVSRSVIISSGRQHAKLGVMGESRFVNKGVAYCATCDAPVYGGKDVVVIGGGNSALDAVLQLSKYARQVYVINRGSAFRADPILIDKVSSAKNVTVYHNASVQEIAGNEFVERVMIQQQCCTTIVLPVQGVFIEIGTSASSDFISFVNKNAHGEIMIDCSCATNIPGLFAAGDVTTVSAKQIIIACGEGAKAAVSAYKYVLQNKTNRSKADISPVV
ncbi:MAG: FAD-dependent oxidoreductase [Endomicrobiales bacterium]|jgi:alkyl hydroperoxide reductase subunit F